MSDPMAVITLALSIAFLAWLLRQLLTGRLTFAAEREHIDRIVRQATGKPTLHDQAMTELDDIDRQNGLEP